MRLRTWVSAFTVTAALAVGAAVACDDDDGTDGDTENFEADLEVANEVPPVTVASDADGRAGFEVSGSTVDYVIEVDDITNVILAHIHVGRSGVAGPIIVELFNEPPPGTGALDDEELIQSSFDEGDIQGLGGNPPISLDSLVTLMERGETYVNVHTVQNPSGEIRGQIF